MKKIALLSLCLLSITFIFSCKNKVEGEAAEVNEAAEVAQTEGVAYAVDTTATQIMWEGVKVTGKHNGTIDVAEGTIYVNDGNVTGGEFTIDMNSIVVLDLEGEWRDNLEAHLKGTASDKADDFFNVNQYPTAKFGITKTTALDKDPEGTHLVYGNLTMKNQTKEIGFKASISNIDGVLTVVTPQFSINRTDWGIKYGSATFIENLGDKAISDEFGVKITLKASAPTM